MVSTVVLAFLGRGSRTSALDSEPSNSAPRALLTATAEVATLCAVAASTKLAPALERPRLVVPVATARPPPDKDLEPPLRRLPTTDGSRDAERLPLRECLDDEGCESLLPDRSRRPSSCLLDVGVSGVADKPSGAPRPLAASTGLLLSERTRQRERSFSMCALKCGDLVEIQIILWHRWPVNTLDMFVLMFFLCLGVVNYITEKSCCFFRVS